MRRRIASGSAYEDLIGYSRAIVDDDGWVFVSGCTGVDPATMTLSDGVEAQCTAALATIAAALGAAGAGFDDVVRVRYILPDADDFEVCWPQLRAAFGIARPAATMIVAGLIDPKMRIEIEVTARVLKRTPPLPGIPANAETQSHDGR
ncbi:Rid family hydrolase [Glacieibacterium megasporae]|uniref:Rid family hydrolase n=1 Tax=Glacieibacterium megasporae TaxID=2835787 RepID=UPI001C1E66E6|nr:Rid family hydrolase [Polymorphobacter megasporae]UAJ11362.1 RidA family protein [Polymorphobacter megasporae]